MRINPNGFVGIGTSFPSYLLHLQQATGNPALFIKRVTNDTNFEISVQESRTRIRTWATANDRDIFFDTDNAGTTRMVIYAGGNIGMPTTYGFTTSNAANLFIDSGAGLLYRSTSSLKYKTDIEDLNIDTTDLLSKMRPVWYRSLGDVDRKDWSWYGFIAEELAEIEPRLVHFGYGKDSYEEIETKADKGNIKIETKLKDNAVKNEPDGVQYERITVLLVAEMQKQNKLLKEQQAQIEELSNKIVALESK
jgi:hypothetical protein